MIRYIIALTALSACSFADPGGVRDLKKVDPLTVDPEGFIVELQLPQGLGIASQQAKISLSATRGKDMATSHEVYVLERMSGSGWAYRIAPRDLPRMRAQQAQVSAWEIADPDDTNGAFSVSLGGCATGAPLDPKAPVSARLQMPGTDAPLPLITGVPVERIIGADRIASLPPC